MIGTARTLAWTVAVLLTGIPYAQAAAQTLVGRVVEEGTGAPVASAAVSLVDRSGAHRAGTISDSLGAFRLAPPEAGEYVVEAIRLGYESTRSPLFALGAEGVVPFEIAMTPTPIGLEGFEVTVEREAEVLLGVFGHTPATLGRRWIDRAAIEKMPAPVGPREVIRWQSVPGMWVHEDGGAPGTSSLCVSFQRGRTFSGAERCAIILLDGSLVSPLEAQAMNPEEIEAIAILTPVDASTFYGTEGGGGAVLIWTRRGR